MGYFMTNIPLKSQKHCSAVDLTNVNKYIPHPMKVDLSSESHIKR